MRRVYPLPSLGAQSLVWLNAVLDEAIEGGKRNGTHRTDRTHGTYDDEGVAQVKLGVICPGMIRFERVRNADGEFAPETDGGVDPATMRAAYGEPSLGKVAGAAAGLGGPAAAALLIARRMKERRAQE